MKKGLSIILTLCLVTGMFVLTLSGCGGTQSGDASADKKLNIVVTIFPEFDWIREILGTRAEDAQITMLLDNGVDLHSYQPSADDLVKIGASDLFVYVGGLSDAWVDDALRSVGKPDLVTVDLMETLGDAVKEEELVEGMQGEEEEEEEEEGPEYDEHVWLSLRNAITICGVLAEKLSQIDPENASLYKANADAYITKLQTLDAQYADAVANAKVKTLLFGDRFPFRYMADDYGLTYYAAFVGCSAESEASFETIVFLADKVDELSLHTILQIESARGDIARTIRENTATKDQQILTMNSLQSASLTDSQSGVTYLSAMTENLDVLRQALA